MRITIIKTLYAIVAVSFFLEATAQGTLSDYQRAEEVQKRYKDKVFNAPSSFQWLKKGNAFWYLNTIRNGKEFIFVDVIKKTQKPAFDQQRLAKTLSPLAHKTLNPKSLPFNQIEFSEDGKNFTFQIDSARWQCELSSYKFKVIEIIHTENKNEEYWGNAFDEAGGKPVKSPDSLWIASIKNYNVYITNRNTKESFPLSYDGSAGVFYSSYMQWSPDSKKLVASKVRPAKKRLIYFVETSPKDQLQPKLQEREYLKPGDELPHKEPQLFLIDEKRHIPVSSELFSDQFYLGDVQWRSDSRAFTFDYNERGHQRYSIIEVSDKGIVRELVRETNKTFIDYSGKTYRYDVADGKEIIWASERDGWNHLYLYDGTSGTIKNQITKGQWVVRSVVYVDEQKRKLIFTASGLDADQDPYLVHYCSINFDGTGFTLLTKSNANHNAVFSPDYTYFVDYQSRVDLPPTSKVIHTDDLKEVMIVQQADVKDLEQAGWKAPEVFSAKARDGVTDIWGIIIRPSNFDSSKKYPVIEMIYAGPQSFYVPKSFSPQYRGLYALAELGFIVVQMDGMGTSWRSKAFHDVCWKNLKDAGFPDRIAWMKAAAARYSYMDVSRVGVFGGSAGGQNAAGAVLFHPEFYKAAVASCGCHDNRMDKMWWNEQWMGYPIGPQYAECSNVVNADKLGGKLMLIVGELDDNVDPASTMQVADALIKAKKDFDLIVVPGMGHSGGGEFGERKRRDFFVRHLLQVTPPDWKKKPLL
jgi:dipeptidyl aminopeptidase/acylaminoacyl peptidase